MLLKTRLVKQKLFLLSIYPTFEIGIVMNKDFLLLRTYYLNYNLTFCKEKKLVKLAIAELQGISLGS